MNQNFNLFHLGMKYLKAGEDHRPPKEATVAKPARLGAVLDSDALAIEKARQREEDSEAQKALDHLRGQLAALDEQQRVGGREVALLLALGAASYGLVKMAGAAWTGRAVGMDNYRGRRGRR